MDIKSKMLHTHTHTHTHAHTHTRTHARTHVLVDALGCRDAATQAKGDAAVPSDGKAPSPQVSKHEAGTDVDTRTHASTHTHTHIGT